MRTNVRVPQIESMLNAGMTYEHIGDELGISKQGVHYIAKKAGLKPRVSYGVIGKKRRKSVIDNYYNRYGFHPDEDTKYLTPIGLKVRALINNARARSKKSGIDFSITLADFYPYPLSCPLLDVKMCYDATGIDNRMISASLDRVDSTKGYVKGNVRIISYRANLIKSNHSKEFIKKLLEYMS